MRASSSNHSGQINHNAILDNRHGHHASHCTPIQLLPLGKVKLNPNHHSLETVCVPQAAHLPLHPHLPLYVSSPRVRAPGLAEAAAALVAPASSPAQTRSFSERVVGVGAWVVAAAAVTPPVVHLALAPELS